jgi:hypothetical protein
MALSAPLTRALRARRASRADDTISPPRNSSADQVPEVGEPDEVVLPAAAELESAVDVEDEGVVEGELKLVVLVLGLLKPP